MVKVSIITICRIGLKFPELQPVYNGHIFVRSCGNLVKLDFDGNEIWKRESVSANNMFYHFVTCGDGKVVDNETGKVYDVNGTYLYQLSMF